MALSEGKIEILGNFEEVVMKKKELEIAKKMINKGEPLEKIIEYTGLTKEEIEKIK